MLFNQQQTDFLKDGMNGKEGLGMGEPCLVRNHC